MKQRTKVTAEIARGVLNRRAEGMKHCAIAQEFGISESTVARILIKNGQRSHKKHRRWRATARPILHSYQSALIIDTSGASISQILGLVSGVTKLGLEFRFSEQAAPKA